MIEDSDGAATNFLVAKLGGPSRIQSVLVKKELQGFNIDRDERDLDAEEAGLRWDPKYTNEKLLDQAISALPDSTRKNGFYASQHHNNLATEVQNTLTRIEVSFHQEQKLSGELRFGASLTIASNVYERGTPNR